MSEQIGTYFHVGLVVEDLDAAIEELSRTLGLEFNEPHDSTYGDSHIRVCYSLQGPPYVELIQGEPGSLWDTAGGPRADHLGYFVDDFEASKQRLIDSGMPVDIDGMQWGRTFSYHRSSHSGLRVELVDSARREQLIASIKPR